MFCGVVGFWKQGEESSDWFGGGVGGGVQGQGAGAAGKVAGVGRNRWRRVRSRRKDARLEWSNCAAAVWNINRCGRRDVAG